MASLGLSMKLTGFTSKIASVWTTTQQLWHKMTANTWAGSDRMPDSSSNTNTAALYTGRGLDFDGVNDTVTIGATGQTIKSIVFYVKPDTTTESFLQLQASGAVEVTIATGTIGTTGWTSPTTYVNGSASSTVAATTWQQIAVTSATGIAASNVILGLSNATYYGGGMSNVKLFDVELSAAQVSELYANPEQAVPAGVGNANLVGWWPLAENVIGYSPNYIYEQLWGAISGATSISSINSPAPQLALKGFSEKMIFDRINDWVDIPDFSLTTTMGFFADFVSVYTAGSLTGIINIGGTYLRVYDTSILFYSGVNLFSINLGMNIKYKRVRIAGRLVSGDMKLYMNGIQTWADTSTFTVAGTWGGIGKYSATTNELFKGIIHEFALFNTALTDTQLEELSDGTISPSSLSAWGYWKNTGNTNADWADLSGNGRDGTVNGSPDSVNIYEGTTQGEDIFDAALSNVNTGEVILNADGYLFTTDDATLDITSAITLEAWVKPFTVSSLQTVIGKNSAYALNVTASGKVQLQRWSSTTSGTVDSTTALTADTWAHIVATYDGTTTKIYIDGSEDKSATSLTGAIDSTATALLTGALTTSTQLFSGYIDSTKVYSSALTSSNILGNYNKESAGH